jgi:hypothetical protein
MDDSIQINVGFLPLTPFGCCCRNGTARQVTIMLHILNNIHHVHEIKKRQPIKSKFPSPLNAEK